MGIRRIDTERCIRCGRCVTYCPQDVIRKTEDKTPVVTYLQDCQSCFLCEQYCPVQAIAVSADRERRPILPWQSF